MSEWSISYEDPNADVRAYNKQLHEFAMQILLHRNTCYLHGEFDPSSQQIVNAYEQAGKILNVGALYEYELYEGIEALRVKYEKQQEEVKP